MIIGRRSFLTGLVSALAAPAIVRAASIMPVRAITAEPKFEIFTSFFEGNPGHKSRFFRAMLIRDSVGDFSWTSSWVDFPAKGTIWTKEEMAESGWGRAA